MYFQREEKPKEILKNYEKLVIFSKNQTEEIEKIRQEVERKNRERVELLEDFERSRGNSSFSLEFGKKPFIRFTCFGRSWEF